MTPPVSFDSRLDRVRFAFLESHDTVQDIANNLSVDVHLCTPRRTSRNLFFEKLLEGSFGRHECQGQGGVRLTFRLFELARKLSEVNVPWLLENTCGEKPTDFQSDEVEQDGGRRQLPVFIGSN